MVNVRALRQLEGPNKGQSFTNSVLLTFRLENYLEFNGALTFPTGPQILSFGNCTASKLLHPFDHDLRQIFPPPFRNSPILVYQIKVVWRWGVAKMLIAKNIT